MASAGKIILRVVFVLCMVLIFVGDYTGLLDRLFEHTKTSQDVTGANANRPSPRPTNPGYGDPKTEIDLDADIEDESIKTMGKNG